MRRKFKENYLYGLCIQTPPSREEEPNDTLVNMTRPISLLRYHSHSVAFEKLTIKPSLESTWTATEPAGLQVISRDQFMWSRTSPNTILIYMALAETCMIVPQYHPNLHGSGRNLYDSTMFSWKLYHSTHSMELVWYHPNLHGSGRNLYDSTMFSWKLYHSTHSMELVWCMWTPNLVVD